jgi:hypothetical protein
MADQKEGHVQQSFTKTQQQLFPPSIDHFSKSREASGGNTAVRGSLAEDVQRMKMAERALAPGPPPDFPPSPLLLGDPRELLTPEQVLEMYGHVYGELSLRYLDSLLAFELSDTLQGNVYHVDRDRLAFRVGVMANKAAERIVAREKEAWALQAQRELTDVRTHHRFELADERQKKNNAKSDMRRLDLTNLHEVERQMKENNDKLMECIPRLEELADLQYVQAHSSKAAPKRKPSAKKIPATPPPPPPPQTKVTEEIYQGGKTGGKKSAKSPKDPKELQAIMEEEERRRLEEEEKKRRAQSDEMDMELHSP